MAVECLNKRGITGLLSIFTSPVIFLLNTMIIMTTMSIAYFFRKRVFVYALVSVIWLLIAVINFVVLCSRKTPFTAMDIYLIKDAIKVIPLYINIFQMIIIIAGVAVVVAALVMIWKKSEKCTVQLSGKKFYIAALFKVGIIFLITYSYTAALIINGYVDMHFGNLAHAYQDYGVAYCFTSSIKDRGIGRSKEYSQEYMDNLKLDLDETSIEVSEKTPNIIFVQLESFFDPKLVKGVEFSYNPTPNFDILREEYSSGYLSVPCFGAGTANTEFEVQTGVNLDDFGPGEYPYRTVMQSKTCESAAYDLKKIGYSTHAIHNNDATFYDRYKVFSHLGYDTFTPIEYMSSDYQKTPLGWAKDKMLVPEIRKTLDSTENMDYIFTISVQGHGDYPSEPILDNPAITVSGSPTEEQDYKWEYYVNQIHEMDQFVKELTDALADYPEDVILVMYGDHLPTMGLTVEDLKNKYLFQTEYVIWDNMGLTKKDENLASYQIAAEVLDRVGIHEGTIMKYHQARRNTKNYQVDLETLQYDVLYGKRYAYGGENLFERTKMRMGLYDVTLDSLRLVSDTDWTYYIQGTNFTPSSQVKLNGEWYDTAYLSPTMLVISGTELKDFDRLAVVQRSNSSTRKALSKSFDRAVYALYDSEWKVASR